MTRANRSFWILAATAIVVAGVLTQALAAPASATADAIVVVSVVILAVIAVLLVRVVRYLARITPADTRTAPRRIRRWQRRAAP
jgi:hypothetical protein